MFSTAGIKKPRFRENVQINAEDEDNAADNNNNSHTEEMLNNALYMKHYMSKSLYWYVRKSLEDMLHDFMLIGKDESGYSTIGAAEISERNQIIIQMFELPLEFDSSSRSLSVQVILDAIKSNIDYPDGCVALIVGLNRRTCSITETLKEDILNLLEGIICREDLGSLYGDMMEPLKELLQVGNKTTDGDLEIVMKRKILNGTVVKKSRRYTKILIELYRRKVVSPTQVLVYMDKLSKKQPDTLFADLLFMMLQEIGLDVESRLKSCGSSQRGSSYHSFGVSSQDDGVRGSTFDNIYKRLDAFIKCVTCNKSVRAMQKVVLERKKRKAMKASTTEILPHPQMHSVLRGRNGAMSNYNFHRSLHQPNTQSESRSTDEALTSL
ncbi:unnamed protein product [Orchesella dallaii]|uniref:Uncharacterized protein n=1 Tax=Orchesella dallaii TaxID=48710 RepID=A0ABP1QZ19_9HEXA